MRGRLTGCMVSALQRLSDVTRRRGSVRGSPVHHACLSVCLAVFVLLSAITAPAPESETRSAAAAAGESDELIQMKIVSEKRDGRPE